jgi:hypothetical protein
MDSRNKGLANGERENAIDITPVLVHSRETGHSAEGRKKNMALQSSNSK